jgi:hypothetical protein
MLCKKKIMCDVFVVDPGFLDAGDGESQIIRIKNEKAIPL